MAALKTNETVGCVSNSGVSPQDNICSIEETSKDGDPPTSHCMIFRRQRLFEHVSLFTELLFHD